ncbi:hypothetical protein AVEN_222266-1 [Araneus ventricosus]|uniref:Uncharacterized protein n=1 Tax=Araneus ventricosus TaxID=182803 RepID=A0A4Y2LAF5_ARAVE|nr:hypothetical protein AVEN_222266-1 [Araneus ventricosus]
MQCLLVLLIYKALNSFEKKNQASKKAIVDNKTMQCLFVLLIYKALNSFKKNQTSKKAIVDKFQMEGLKPSEILAEENAKGCNNNDGAIDINTPSCSTPQTRLKLATFARTCDRYGVADRPAAALASALLYDLSREII